MEINNVPTFSILFGIYMVLVILLAGKTALHYSGEEDSLKDFLIVVWIIVMAALPFALIKLFNTGLS